MNAQPGTYIPSPIQISLFPFLMKGVDHLFYEFNSHSHLDLEGTTDELNFIEWLSLEVLRFANKFVQWATD